MICLPEKHYITLPYGAVGILGESPNGLMFSNRHSYLLSSPGVGGFIDWLLVNGRRGIGLVSFSSNEALLQVQGIFQHGMTTVLLKALPRQVVISASIVAQDRLAYLQARRELGYMLSWDIATSVTPEDDTALPGAFDRPEVWTWTFVDSSDERVHFDFAAAWVSDDDNDFESPDANSSDISITLAGDDPAFYGDEISIPISGRTSTQLSSAPSKFVTNTFRYTGTARGYIVANIDMSGTEPTASLYAIGLADVTDTANVRWRRFQYVDYPASGWKPFNGASQQFVWDIRGQQLYTGNNSLHLSADPGVTQTWGAFQLIPGRSYRLFVEASREIGVYGTINYRNRYSSV